MLLELEEAPLASGVELLLERGADVDWRHPCVCTRHGLPTTPLEYLCEGENFGWRYEGGAWKQDCPEKWETWRGVVGFLVAAGASTERFPRLEEASERRFAVPALECAATVATRSVVNREEIELETPADFLGDEVELSHSMASSGGQETERQRESNLARLGASEADIEILRVSRGIPRTPSHDRGANHHAVHHTDVDVRRAPNAVFRARGRRAIAAHLRALATRGAEAAGYAQMI